MQGIRLHQYVGELDAAEEALERSRLAALVSGIGGLGNGHAQRLGLQTHLGNERRCGTRLLIDRAAQRLAIAHEKIDAIRQGRLLTHPLEQQGLEGLHIELQEQVTERGIRRWLADLQAKNLIDQSQVAGGEPLHANQGALATQDGQDRHKKHPPLRIAHSSAHPAAGQGLQQGDQIGSGAKLAWIGRDGDGKRTIFVDRIPC